MKLLGFGNILANTNGAIKTKFQLISTLPIFTFYIITHPTMYCTLQFSSIRIAQVELDEEKLGFLSFLGAIFLK